MGKIMVGLGVVLLLVGGAVLLLGRLGAPLGRLPGDIVYRGKNATFYFPLATCIVVSLVLSFVMFLVHHFNR
jgi:Protein of unknown function (DUF2905)